MVARSLAPRGVRPTPELMSAVERNGGGRNFSHRLSQVAARYGALLESADLPDFGHEELDVIRDALRARDLQPAREMRGRVWVIVRNGVVDGLAEKWGADGDALVEKLRGLSHVAEVRLVEDVEAFWAGQREEERES